MVFWASDICEDQLEGLGSLSPLFGGLDLLKQLSAPRDATTSSSRAPPCGGGEGHLGSEALVISPGFFSIDLGMELLGWRGVSSVGP